MLSLSRGSKTLPNWCDCLACCSCSAATMPCELRLLRCCNVVEAHCHHLALQHLLHHDRLAPSPYAPLFDLQVTFVEGRDFEFALILCIGSVGKGRRCADA